MKAGRIGAVTFTFAVATCLYVFAQPPAGGATPFAGSTGGSGAAGSTGSGTGGTNGSGTIGGWSNCGSGDPGPFEVYLYADANYGGSCTDVHYGLYPLPTQFGLPNDSISSVKVGSQMRARIFADAVYAGAFYSLTPQNYATMPAGWDEQVSSMRIDFNSRSQTCNDLGAGEFAVFRDAGEASDCVVLQYGVNYPDDQHMGIANDSISSINPGPAYSRCPSGQNGRYSVILYTDPNYSGSSARFTSGTAPQDLPTINDAISSIGSQLICLG
jgi:hypothetical protein